MYDVAFCVTVVTIFFRNCEKLTKSLQFHWILNFCHPNLHNMVENVMVNRSDEVWEGQTMSLRFYCPENDQKKWVFRSKLAFLAQIWPLQPRELGKLCAMSIFLKLLWQSTLMPNFVSKGGSIFEKLPLKLLKFAYFIPKLGYRDKMAAVTVWMVQRASTIHVFWSYRIDWPMCQILMRKLDGFIGK